MIKSGLYVPIPAMPIPDFAVPYAAPAPINPLAIRPSCPCSRYMHIQPNIICWEASGKLICCQGNGRETYSKCYASLELSQ